MYVILRAEFPMQTDRFHTEIYSILDKVTVRFSNSEVVKDMDRLGPRNDGFHEILGDTTQRLETCIWK